MTVDAPPQRHLVPPFASLGELLLSKKKRKRASESFQCSPRLIFLLSLSPPNQQTKFETKSNRVKGLSFHPHR